jgi:hypothetical protein
MAQTINKDGAYLAALFATCAGALGMYLVLSISGVPNSEVSPEVNAAFMSAFTTGMAAATIGFIEAESA